ncbi:LysE family transporter [Methylobacterium crusticola]|uniref:LysE family transporter n=1 Tax=Methylobacterium crusticola TaxID=1697972 RepID=UPI000FFCB3AF|nr:LysE family transporter [Methylobacterium crusticola]
MEGLPASITAGMGIGLAVAAPVGPMGVLCIQRTLSSGFGAGVVTGLGAALVQTTWGGVVLGCLQTPASTWTDAQARALSLLSAALLFIFAVRVSRRRMHFRISMALIGRDLPLVQFRGRARCLGSDLTAYFATALMVGFANPLTLLLLSTVMPALRSVNAYSDAWLVLTGQFCGALSWWCMLSAAIAALRTYLNNKAVRYINIISGLVLVILAGRAFARAVGI